MWKEVVYYFLLPSSHQSSHDLWDWSDMLGTTVLNRGQRVLWEFRESYRLLSIYYYVFLLNCLFFFLCIFVPKQGFHHCASETSMRQRNRISHHIWVLKWTLTMCINPKWLTAKTMLALIVVYFFLSFIMFFIHSWVCKPVTPYV